MNKEELHNWLTLGANVGVLIGLGLLIYEIRQNSELMSAEIHTIRAEGKASRQMDLANNGVAMTIAAKARSLGFPQDPDAVNELSYEERVRLALMYTAILEATENWHIQCQHGLLNDATCTITQRDQLEFLLPLAKGIGVDLVGRTPSFIAEAQNIASDAGLPVPSDDGSWPED